MASKWAYEKRADGSEVKVRKWQEITDLTLPAAELATPELRSLAPIWGDWQAVLNASVDSAAIAEIGARVLREAAVETGIIERLYTLSRGTTEQIIVKGIHAALIPHQPENDMAPEDIADMVRDHNDAMEGLFDFVARRRVLTPSHIKELHAQLTRKQEFILVTTKDGKRVKTRFVNKGVFKLRPNNPFNRARGFVHEYCPPDHTVSEIDRLVEMHRAHTEAGIPPEVEAAWLHHRFVQIHPFEDGNGSRALNLAGFTPLPGASCQHCYCARAGNML